MQADPICLVYGGYFWVGQSSIGYIRDIYSTNASANHWWVWLYRFQFH
jgi:hypothetical protein